MRDDPEPSANAAVTIRRSLTIGLIGFFTLVDLFATQAILPSLATKYQVSPSAIGLAANAGTIGMAIAGLFAAIVGRRVERRTAIGLSLTLLSVPTALLALAPGLTVFALLRVAQGLCMATAFTLTLAYLGERCSKTDAAGALAAYVTGGVASNLVGRLVAATVAGTFGTDASFLFFAGLNLAGAWLAYVALGGTSPALAIAERPRNFWSAWSDHLANPQLLRAFAIGFLILFGFIGTFTYVGFVLMRPPLGLSMMTLGLVFFAFAPSLITTPLAGKFATRIGAHRALPAGLVIACAGLAMLLVLRIEAFVAGLVLVAIGTFFAQAVATGFVSSTALSDRPAASGLYLSAYYCGGLAGAAVVGQLFDRFGWNWAVAGIFASLALAALLGLKLRASNA